MVKSEFADLPVADLVEDMDLYPRHAVDTVHVATLAAAIESGTKLPPIVVDKKSKRITDGWHRCRAYRRALGNDALVSCEVIPYRNEQQMIVDAVSRNSAHGRRLDKIDVKRSVLMLERHGCSDKLIASVVHLPEQSVVKLKVAVATSAQGNGSAIPGTDLISLKRNTMHLAGETLSETQVAAHKIAPGVGWLLHVKQLRMAIAAKIVDLSNERIVTELQLLKKELDKLSL